jgi:hypothetical protein
MLSSSFVITHFLLHNTNNSLAVPNGNQKHSVLTLGSEILSFTEIHVTHYLNSEYYIPTGSKALKEI